MKPVAEKSAMNTASIKELAARMRLQFAQKEAASLVQEIQEELQEETKEKLNEASFFSERDTENAWIWPIYTDAAAVKESDVCLPVPSVHLDSIKYGTDRFGNQIEYNEEQIEAITTAAKGKDCIIIGAAGTGKTTVTKAVISELIYTNKAGVLNGEGHKYLPSGTPGIVCVSYTRRAVTNLRRNMSQEMKNNCMTIHKLLEYGPVFYDVTDPKTGESKTKMRFEPARHKGRPLPRSIHTLAIDEASMVSTGLFFQLMEAFSHDVQVIFLGDIQQLPPTFGPAILGYKMLELPTIELKTVYRQALESPIIRLAHRILSGKPIPAKEYTEWHFDGKLKLHPWAKKIVGESACIVYCQALTKRLEAGLYDPEEDIVLCPYNVSFGTEEINKHIAQYLAKKHNRDVYEIIAGFERFYYSVGDKVLYDREDAIITKITRNANYYGKSPQKESTSLSYWGFDAGGTSGIVDEDDTDFLLAQVAAKTGEVEERVNQASHRVTLFFTDSEQELEIDTTGEIKSMMLGYALTVHKAQGSEWRRVFLALHQSHATMVSRELLYTAVTRAREELHVVCEPETFTKGINSQRIKGNTLKEKAEYFKGKLEENNGKLLK